MVTYTSNRTSPKRKAADSTERTPQQIDETNAALRMFTARGRQHNRWMQSMTESISPGEGATEPTVEESSRGNSATLQDDTQNTSLNAMAHSTNRQTHTNNTPVNVQYTAPASHASSERPADSSHLVEYVTPYVGEAGQIPTPLTSTAAPFSRPPSEGRSRPSLPSPALSDEITDAPANAIVIPDDSSARVPLEVPIARPRGRTGNLFPALSATQNRLVGRPGNRPSRDFAANAISGRAPLQVTVPGNNLKSPPRPPNAYVPTPMSNTSSAHLRPQTPTSSTNHIPSQTASASAVPPRVPQMLPNASNVYSTARMAQRLDDSLGGFGQNVNGLDKGRKQLLMEAVRMCDFFYIVLHQMFCLQSCNPTSLPLQLSRMPPASWVVLESLLCPNRSVTPHVLKWFSEFPSAIQTIGGSGDAPAFVKQMESIETFLKVLPERWQPFVTACHLRLTPPLTQEMVENFHLTSSVLQTTAFRAIARVFWGENDTRGSQILESIHRTDQETYNIHQWRRTDVEKSIALGILKNLFHLWSAWCTTTGNSPEAFVAPGECNYFKEQPRSMVNSALVNNDRRLTVAQQQRLVETNHHLQVQQQTTLPGLAFQPQHHLNSRSGTQGQVIAPRLPVHQSSSQHPSSHINTSTSTTFITRQQHGTYPASGQIMSGQGLFPAENAPPRPMPVHPDTTRVSLHQAHLRSPVPGPKQLVPNGLPLYRHVTGYALIPTALDRSLHAQSITFLFSKAQIDQIPATTPAEMPGEPGIRVLTELSQLYRLRCSKIPARTGFQTDSSWVTADNVWPDALIFQINGHPLEPRRKLHHGRYLPIDLSPHLQVGENTLSAFTLPNTQDPSAYAVAIERIGITTHDFILSNTPTISSQDSLAAIKRSLTIDPNEDDDIGITSSTLTIPLFDPFRADRICDTPVRGTDCRHRECFDLETFLSQCKREEPGYPCVPDCWRCPICKGDVRPQRLLKDGFLMQVRDELKEKNVLQTRAIIVQPDGSWEPKAEEQATGVKSASLEREEADVAASVAPGGKGKQKVVEVIELD